MRLKIALTTSLVSFIACLGVPEKAAAAAIVWNGPSVTFSKAGFVNPALPVNQDRLTDLIWITRANTEGLLNAKTELTYTHDVSPAGTEWATGTLANYASLTYKPWELWADGLGMPPATVGKDAVLHLIAEDIYLDIKFTSWGKSPTGGAFSYIRSSPIPEPTASAVFCVGALLASTRRRSRQGSTPS